MCNPALVSMYFTIFIDCRSASFMLEKNENVTTVLFTKQKTGYIIFTLILIAVNYKILKVEIIKNAVRQSPNGN